MKRASLHIAEWLYSVSFLLFLFGSSLAHTENGPELSLWVMTFSITLTLATTLLPLAGVRWLKMEPKGWRAGYWAAMLLQAASWVTFFWAMFLPGPQPAALPHLDYGHHPAVGSLAAGLHLQPTCPPKPLKSA